MKNLKDIIVTAKTFGSKIEFSFELSSISKTTIGLHTYGPKSSRCPFIKNSILELNFRGSSKDQPFTCIAKVVDVIYDKTQTDRNPQHFSPYIKKHEQLFEHEDLSRNKISLLTRSVEDPRYLDAWKVFHRQLSNIDQKHG